MEQSKLDQLRALLPHRYAKTLAEQIGDPEITDAVIHRVFSGDITDYSIVSKVVEKAMQWAEDIRKAKEKLDSVINP